MVYTKLKEEPENVFCLPDQIEVGVLPRQKFERVQVVFLIIEILAVSLNWAITCLNAPWPSEISLYSGDSPAIFPKAKTALCEHQLKGHGLIYY